MMRHLPALAAVGLAALVMLPVSGRADAQEGAASSVAPGEPAPGRFTMVPTEGGFVRLDTRTGLVSHCRRETSSSESPWRCAAIPEDTMRAPDRLAALSEEIEALQSEVAALRMRVDALDRERKDAPSAPAPELGQDEEMNRALDFSEELMRRFFGLVQEMKRQPDGRT